MTMRWMEEGRWGEEKERDKTIKFSLGIWGWHQIEPSNCTVVLWSSHQFQGYLFGVFEVVYFNYIQSHLFYHKILIPMSIK